MDTRFLQTFLAVVETGSLTQAARALNITPSAVMQRIKALESEIGPPLIHRSGSGMGPTAAGAAILRDARLAVNAVGDVKAAAAGRVDVGLLRVGVINTVLSGLMPDVMLALRENRPGIELYLLPGPSADLYARLSDGELDAAIIVKPIFAIPKTMEWTLLREEPMLLATPLSMSEIDPVAILKSQPFIRYDRNHWGGRAVDRYLRTRRISPREQHELDSIEAITVLVSRGLGVALIPDWLPPWPQGAEVRKIPVTDAPMRAIGLIRPKVSRRQPLIGAFVDEVAAVVAALGLATTAVQSAGGAS